jgi:hypothetical protein
MAVWMRRVHAAMVATGYVQAGPDDVEAFARVIIAVGPAPDVLR